MHKHPAYCFANFVVWVYFTVFTRWRVEGRENVPRTGGFLVIANHTNAIDPPLVNACINRRIIFLAKRELVTEMGGYKRWCVVHYGLIPINRKGLDREALRMAADAMAHGEVVGMFPEGTRSRSGALQKAISGAAMVAQPHGVPILPMGVAGMAGKRISLNILRRPRVTVRIGKPFTLPFPTSPDRSTLSAATHFMMEHIAELLPETQRGEYAQNRPEAHGNGAEAE